MDIQKPETRHLTIMFTDIRGFTGRTSLHTRGELHNLLHAHDDVIRHIFRKHGGTIVKTIGDAFMVAFTRPTDAVLCGMEIQENLRNYNEGKPKHERIEVRVGINTGEVNVKEGDVYGEPVNIASRIESISEPGTVYLTEAVYLSMNKREIPSVDIGRKKLKGIADRVRVYKVLMHPRAQLRYHAMREKMVEESAKPDVRKFKKRYILIGILIVLVIALLAGFSILGLFEMVGELVIAFFSGDFATASGVSGNISQSIAIGLSRAVGV